MSHSTYFCLQDQTKHSDFLLDMSELDTVSTLRLDPSTPACPRHACMRWVTVEPALILTVVSVGLHIPLSTQYLWERFSQDRGYNLTKVSNCTDRSSDPQHKVERL